MEQSCLNCALNNVIMTKVVSHSLFTDFDINLFKAGKHFKLYEKLGSHLIEVNGVKALILPFGRLRRALFPLSAILTIGTKQTINCMCAGTAVVSGRDLCPIWEKVLCTNILFTLRIMEW